MSNYNYDPYGYGYFPPRPPPPPADINPVYPNNSSPYPYPPAEINPVYPNNNPPYPYSYSTLHPSHSFSTSQYPPPRPQHSYESLYGHPSPSPWPYSYPEPAAPSDPVIVPDYPPHSSLHQHGSFHYDDNSSQSYSAELVIPPPHSDEFIAAYGRFNSTPTSHTTASTGGDSHSLSVSTPYPTPLPVSSPYPTSSSVAYPLESVLSDLRLHDTAPHVSHSPSFTNQSPSFHQQGNLGMYDYSDNTVSSTFSVQTPISAPATPFSWQQQGGQNVSFGGAQHGSSMQIVAFQPGKASLKVLLLHGILDIWIYEAKSLPNMDKLSKTIGDLLGKPLIDSINGKLESTHIPSITSDPYVSISVGTAVLGRTYVISNNENPVWNQHFSVPVAHYAAEVTFIVKDNDIIGADLIGTVRIPVEQIYAGSVVKGIHTVLDSSGKPCKQGATLNLSIQYIPVEMHSMYGHGVGPGYSGVPSTYFPLRKGGSVKLYQDAHVPDGCLPIDFRMENGMYYNHGKCWKDICEAMTNARRLIYITGWSVYHKVQLVRDSPIHGSDITLGDLLKSKSKEGVRVLLLIWDDPTSMSILGYQKEGFLQTHDEETRRFFKHSSVHVLLCPRSAGKRHSWLNKKEVGIIYTHHQKTVIVDSDAGYDNMRKIVAFVGGLDLCDGRYDTPHHPLFKTLETIHKEDNHNPTFVGTNIGGPREPWHDLHSRIDGPAAYDVLKNFEERWLKASKPHGMKKLKKQYDDKLLEMERIPDILGREQLRNLNHNDPETWHVQIFRSIDSNSVKGFPKDPKEDASKSLLSGKNVLIDMSIHIAYVEAIRAAQHFIYIENQYFLGSSYNWESHKDLGANNLIPMEIALKIASKIKSNERFSAYIVIPMWPEGDPTGVPTQRILYWQNKTMQMMYEVVYKALIEVGLDNTYVPQDYLNFFCLGNREALDGNPSVVNPTAANGPIGRSQKSRRFMIYVHSKGMIVDDEYVIIGSANINQRSLEGTRDTEIAMGAYQPQYTWARKSYGPRGQIYAYRMSLWTEHIGFHEECFTNPESIECMRRIRTLGEFNWQQFIADEVTDMKGHLLKYPVDVDRKGKIRPLPGCSTFPDVGGNICGSFTVVQENLTI